MSRGATTILMITAIMASTTTYAQSPSASSSPAAPKVASQTPSEVEIVARKLCEADPVIGTRIAVKRRCNTPAELAEYQRQAREWIENYRRMPCVGGTTGGDTAQAVKC